MNTTAKVHDQRRPVVSPVVRPSRLIACILCTLFVTACETTPDLYQWDKFANLQYDVLRQAGVDPNEQMTQMQETAEKAKSSGLKLPPGFRAHWGLLHLQAGNATKARTLFMDEKAAFPESSTYIDRLLRRLSTDKATAGKAS